MGFNFGKAVLRIGAGAGLIMTLSSYALCADNPNKDNYWAELAERLKQQLSLTEDQTAKIQTILENMVSISSEDAAVLPQNGHEIRDEIYSVLTQEQRRKYEELQASKNESDQ
jgi:Spy/CpxP family protein refolding chaperone